jgi:2-alkyl-3-oxoalkanoate reductase
VRVLVTGANGFLGRHVVGALLSRGHSVRALVRPAASVEPLGWPPAVEVVRADLRGGALESLFPGVEAVIHLAAAVTGGEDAQFAATVVGTERLLAAMEGFTVRRLVLASSFSVYDWSHIHGTLDEDSPLEAAPDLYERDGYAVAKSWQERIVRASAKQKAFELVVLRPGWIWGQGLGYLAGLGQRFGSVHLVIGPATRLPLTHVDNCADLFALCVDAPAAAGETFNVVDSDEVRIWQYLSDYLRRSGEAGWRIPVPYRLAYATAQVASATSKWIFNGKGKLPSVLVPCRFEARFKPLRFSNAKVRRVLSWAPPFSYEACLDRTYGRLGAGTPQALGRSANLETLSSAVPDRAPASTESVGR